MNLRTHLSGAGDSLASESIPIRWDAAPFVGRLARLNGAPQLVIDDPERFVRSLNVVFIGPHAAALLFATLRLRPSAAVPRPRADIPLLRKNEADRDALPPFDRFRLVSVPRCSDIIVIQARCDLPVRSPVAYILKMRRTTFA